MDKLSYGFKQRFLGKPLLTYRWRLAPKVAHAAINAGGDYAALKILCGFLQLCCDSEKTAVRPLLINGVNPLPQQGGYLGEQRI